MLHLILHTMYAQHSIMSVHVSQNLIQTTRAMIYLVLNETENQSHLIWSVVQK